VPPGRTTPPAWVERLQAIALPIFGSRRVVRARAVFDRYNAGGGGLLAAGIAYNTLFALVPMALFAGGLLGFLVKDPESLAAIARLLTAWAPPLSSVIEEVLGGLAVASPQLSIIGLVGMIWGATRLYASLETGVEAMFAGVPRRGIVSRTIRRVGSVLVIAAVVVTAFVASSLASFVAELGLGGGPVAFLAGTALLALPIVVATVAVAMVYRLVPPSAPPSEALVRPAFVIGAGLVLLTRLFAVLAPRLLGANFVYGTLGTIFVALAWLGLAFSMILIGAAWVRERMLGQEATAAVA
jgi:membrane protein